MSNLLYFIPTTVVSPDQKKKEDKNYYILASSLESAMEIAHKRVKNTYPEDWFIEIKFKQITASKLPGKN
jgi:uncharacterized membrane protein YkoI